MKREGIDKVSSLLVNLQMNLHIIYDGPVPWKFIEAILVHPLLEFLRSIWKFIKIVFDGWYNQQKQKIVHCTECKCKQKIRAVEENATINFVFQFLVPLSHL